MKRPKASTLFKVFAVASAIAAILGIGGFCIWLSTVDKSYADYMANKWSAPLTYCAVIALTLILAAGKFSAQKPSTLLLALAWGMFHAAWLFLSVMKATTGEILQNMAYGLGATLIVIMILTSCNPRVWKGIVLRVLVPFGVMCPFWILPEMFIPSAIGCGLCIGGGWLASRLARNLSGPRVVKSQEPTA